MSEDQPWDNTRVTTMAVTVSFSHGADAWAGQYRVFFKENGGHATQLGSATIEFGPFDSYIEVGYWLSGLSKVLKTMTAEPVRATPPDSPPGNDSAPGTNRGR